MPDLRVVPLSADVFEAWAELFEACASGCFCRYWHFEGTKNEWLARLAFDALANRDAQSAALAAGDQSARGLVALSGARAVGWLKLLPRCAVPKLRRLPVYRPLDLGSDPGVFSLACFLVLPSERRLGVARALLRGAIEDARAAGAHVLEAYPHRRSEGPRDEELWMGPEALFLEHGFTASEDAGANHAYPVLRLRLDHSSTSVVR